MRAAICSFVALLLVASAGLAQDGKKKDAKSEPKMMWPDVKEVAGKGFDQWLAEIRSTDPSRRENAMESILAFGPEKSQKAVLAILLELKKHNNPAPVDMTVRIRAAATLATILTSLPNDEKLNPKQLKPNPAHLKEAVTQLHRMMRDEQLSVKIAGVQAISQLAFLAPEVQDYTDDVIGLANNKQTWQARKAGLEALIRIAMARSKLNKEPLPKVLPTFESRAKGYGPTRENSMLVRITAIQSLAQWPGALGDDIMRERLLDEILKKDPEPSVHIWAELALMTVKKKVDAGHLAGIIKLLRHKSDPAIRIQAANSLAMLGAQPPFGAKDPKKEKALNGKDRALVVKELTSCFTDPDINVASACIGALFVVEPDNAADPVARMLNDEEPIRRAQAARALGILGDKGKVMENLLIAKLTTEKNLEVKAFVITALVQMVSMNAVPALQKLAATPPTGKPKDEMYEKGLFIQQAAKDAARLIPEIKERNDKQEREKTPKAANK